MSSTNLMQKLERHSIERPNILRNDMCDMLKCLRVDLYKVIKEYQNCFICTCLLVILITHRNKLYVQVILILPIAMKIIYFIRISIIMNLFSL